MIKDLFRKDLMDFKPYELEENNYSIRLDANESFLNFPIELEDELLKEVRSSLFNRYPDPFSSKVCRLYADYADTSYENIIAGNGSDELIQIIVNAFISPGDKVMLLSPDFSMYRLYTKLAGGTPVEFELRNNFQFDAEAFIEKANCERAKLVFISNPNNPTGGVIAEDTLLKIVANSNSIVVIDEAYYEFYGRSLVGKINNYENLVILRTCSKAVGLAALRLGFLITNKMLLQEFKKTKPPFNVNSMTQAIASVILSKPEYISRNIESIVTERNYLIEKLRILSGLTVYPTEANFVLIECDYIQEIKNRSLQSGISIRSFKSPRLKNCLRVTAGSREENTAFLNSCLKVIK
jgi:histidinol-phosphate aminotransferase